MHHFAHRGSLRSRYDLQGPRLLCDTNMTVTDLHGAHDDEIHGLIPTPSTNQLPWLTTRGHMVRRCVTWGEMPSIPPPFLINRGGRVVAQAYPRELRKPLLVTRVASFRSFHLDEPRKTWIICAKRTQDQSTQEQNTQPELLSVLPKRLLLRHK